MNKSILGYHKVKNIICKLDKVFKKVTDSQKKEILELFYKGNSIKDISKTFQFTVPTITRQLKNLLGENEFLKLKRLRLKNQVRHKQELNKTEDSKKNKKLSQHKEEIPKNDLLQNEITEKESYFESSFIEITPLNFEINSTSRKDLTSVSLESIDFPGEVFMIVSNKIELQTKFLKEYNDWQFLPLEDLERNTIEIFQDLKSAKRLCKKDQKVIKVPNTQVFKIVAPILLSRGISRIISNDKLIAL